MPPVKFDEDAARQLVELPKEIKARVADLIARLSKWPNVSGAKPLRGRLAGRFRLRSGDYRLQYYVEGDEKSPTVVVEQVGHRDGFYDD